MPYSIEIAFQYSLAYIPFIQPNKHTPQTVQLLSPWASAILSSTSQDGRAQPWRDMFRGQIIDKSQHGKPDLAPYAPCCEAGN